MKKIALFLLSIFCGITTFATEVMEYSSIDGAQTISISYNIYGNGANPDANTFLSYTWQSSSTSIIAEAVEVALDDDFDSWMLQKGQQFTLEIEGVCNASGKLLTGIVDEQQEADWWFLNSEYGSPSIEVIAGEQFQAKILYTITALATEQKDATQDVPGLVFGFEMADYAAATDFNGQDPADDLSNVKKIEFEFTTFRFSYIGSLEQYSKPYVLTYQGSAEEPTDDYKYQGSTTLSYDNAATTSDYFNFHISGVATQDISSLEIALWDASYMATRPFATSLCTEDNTTTTILTDITAGETFEVKSSLPLLKNSNGTENLYKIVLLAYSEYDGVQIILDLNSADEFSIGEKKYESETEEVQYAVVDGIRYGYAADTAFVAPANNETSYSGDIEIPSEIIVEGKNYTVTQIGDEAFNYSDILSVTIPASITRLGNYAFGHCYQLSSISFAEGLISIGYDAFSECSNLSSITLPNSLISIEDGAFAHCQKLTSIIIPKNVVSISSGEIFNDCINLEYIEVDKNNPKYDSRDNCNAIIETETNTLIAGCKSTIIPESITKIGEYAFYGCIKYKITIPQGVVSIEKGAFYQCDSLNSIDLPESLLSIGPSAFSNCINLPYIYIPQNVTFIGNNAFLQCFNLKTIIIPKNVTTIEYDVFHSCFSLYHIEVEKGNTVFDSRDNCNAIIVTATNSLIAGCSNTIIPETVTSIDEGALMDYNKMSIKIPNRVQSIGNRVFLGSKITTITIPPKVNKLGYDVFSSCSELSQIFCSATVPPVVNYYNIEYENFNPTLIVPCESFDSYRNHEYWGQFANIECYTLKIGDIEDITLTDGDVLPTIDLSQFFTKAENEEITYTVASSDNNVVYPALRGDKLGFVQYGTGTATITVTASVDDFSAETSFTITIEPQQDQPQIPCELSISSEITDATCNGVANGKIELSVSGGTEPYQYKWTTGRTSSGIYNVGAGSYSVLVIDDNGCTATETFSIIEPSAVTIFETITNPSCGKSNGRIDLTVFGGTEPYSYEWKGSTQTTSTIENLSARNYTVTITDGNSCTAAKTFSLSEQNAPIISEPTVTPSKCNEPQGSIQLDVSGGMLPYIYEWSDSTEVADGQNRPRMFAGEYSLTVIDGNNCRATMSVTVPPIPFKQPEIALVSYGDTARHNLVVWQKENTNDIDFYNIYRETDQAGVYEKIGTSAYHETSIFIDETADFKTQASRYRLSASNKCWESPLSKEYKTIQLSFEKEENGTVHLWWDAYEGCEYVKYTILRLTRNGIEEYKDVPANKFRYTIDNVEAGTIGFFISVELINQVDVNKPLKSESGPFVIVVSNIAELENRDAINESAENQVLAFGGDKSIFVNNAKGEDVIVCDLTGKTIAQKKNVDSTTIPVQTAGVYIVIVGDRAFKVVVQ